MESKSSDFNKDVRKIIVSVLNVKTKWANFAHKFLGQDPNETAKPLPKKSDLLDASKNTDQKAEQSKADKKSNETIRQLIEENDLLANGKVSFVNLSKIREKLGDKWPRYQSSVKQFAKKVIEQRITPQDLYYQVGEDIYVFVFSNLNQEESVIKCSLIAKEIGEQIFGDEWSTDKYSTTVAVSEENGSVFFKETSLEETIAESLSKATQFSPCAALEQVGPKQVEDTLNRINSDMTDVEKSMEELSSSVGKTLSPRETVSKFTAMMEGLQHMDSLLSDVQEVSKLSSNEPNWQIFHNENYAENEASVSSLSDKLGSLIGAAESLYGYLQESILPQLEDEDENSGFVDVQSDTVPNSAEDTELEDIVTEEDPDLSFHYKPLWHPASNRIHTYSISANVLLESATWAIDDLNDEMDRDVIALLDQLVLRHALVDLHDILERGKVSAVAVPVHFSTLNNKTSRLSYVEVCRGIPEEYRRLIVWEIVGSQLSSWYSQLITSIGAIKNYGRMICLEVEPDHPQFRDLKSMGVDAVGFRCSKSLESEGDLIRIMSGFSKRAEQQGLKTYAFNLPTSSMTLAALMNGFDFISGAVVADNADMPAGVTGYNFPEMYQKYARRRGYSVSLRVLEPSMAANI